VDTSLFEAGIIHTFWQSAIALATGVSPGAMGSAHPLSAPYQAFETKDGWVTVGAANQSNWRRLLEILGADEIARDARFETNRGRMENRLALEAALTPHFRRRASAEWLATFEREGLPAGPILSITEMHRDPQTLARGMIQEVAHTRLGRVKTLGPPVKLSATPAAIRRGAPLLGEHSREVLAEIGYAEAEIDALAAKGAIRVP
ncbi:MAG: CaiB/BaiF CoA transferase family protein, partial [Alphaproteobacteria bacterium]